MNYPNLIKEWQRASEDLGIEIVAPFFLTLPGSNIQIKVAVLVKNFGTEKGTLVVGNYSDISTHIKEILKLGYGFSTLSEPENSNQYSREDFIDMLQEWGWINKDGVQKPAWL